MSSSDMSSLLSSQKNRRPSMNLPLRRLQSRGSNIRARCASGREPKNWKRIERVWDWQSFSAFQLAEASRPLHMHRRWSALKFGFSPTTVRNAYDAIHRLNILCWSLLMLLFSILDQSYVMSQKSSWLQHKVNRPWFMVFGFCRFRIIPADLYIVPSKVGVMCCSKR